MDSGGIGFRFMQLADELILAIIEQINDNKSLCTLAATCRRLQQLVEPYIYRNLLLTDGSQATTLLNAFNSRPDRLAGIRILGIYVGHKLAENDPTERSKGIEALESFIYRMRNLRQLTLEALCCNDGPFQTRQPTRFPWTSTGSIDYKSLFEKASLLITNPELRALPFLQSLTLHSHGLKKQRYALGENSVVFIHPNLRYLKISCFDVDRSLKDLPMLHDHRHSTNLKDLVLEECNISTDGLEALLQCPKELKTLVLGERMHHFHRPNYLPLGSSPSFIRALKLHQPSLTYLKHVGGKHPSGLPWPTRGFGYEDMVKLLDLRTLEISSNSIFNDFLRQKAYPQNLEILRSLDKGPMDMEVPSKMNLGLIQTLGLQSIRSLKEYHMVLSQAPIPGDDVLDIHWRYQQRRINVYKTGQILKSQGVRFKVFAVQGFNFIPPYMYGEPVPRELLAYDSEYPTTFGSVRDDDVVDQAVDDPAEESSDTIGMIILSGVLNF
ncbi:hypothetical protein M501DRAFT_1059710 [Patellaria atrata CBS 101060]|uniref:F-box domain-containing protein n=1 Tax=Patellaria atrata CBS 101060 TaxID=1346257 RepID=A0A9P4S7U0_9PEZI|nr:hypothetical protein M501DRAFT_1059710 [Patellaria atrata CBS 101060]